MVQREWVEKDFYKVLGVSSDAKEDEIKRVARKLLAENHPDRNPNNPAAEERYKEIGEAKDVLTDPAKRKEYDDALAASRLSDKVTSWDDEPAAQKPPKPIQGPSQKPPQKAPLKAEGTQSAKTIEAGMANAERKVGAEAAKVEKPAAGGIPTGGAKRPGPQGTAPRLGQQAKPAPSDSGRTGGAKTAPEEAAAAGGRGADRVGPRQNPGPSAAKPQPGRVQRPAPEPEDGAALLRKKLERERAAQIRKVLALGAGSAAFVLMALVLLLWL